MCGNPFQPGVLVFAESKGWQTKDTSAWHFQQCQSQEGLSELVVYTRDGAITLNSQQAHTAVLQHEYANPRTLSLHPEDQKKQNMQNQDGHFCVETGIHGWKCSQVDDSNSITNSFKINQTVSLVMEPRTKL